MPKYVIVIKSPKRGRRLSSGETQDAVEWEVRKLLPSESGSTDPLIERSGETLIRGESSTPATAKIDAEEAAEKLNEAQRERVKMHREVYVYNPKRSEPTERGTPPSP